MHREPGRGLATVANGKRSNRAITAIPTGYEALEADCGGCGSRRAIGDGRPSWAPGGDRRQLSGVKSVISIRRGGVDLHIGRWRGTGKVGGWAAAGPSHGFEQLRGFPPVSRQARAADTAVLPQQRHNRLDPRRRKSPLGSAASSCCPTSAANSRRSSLSSTSAKPPIAAKIARQRDDSQHSRGPVGSLANGQTETHPASILRRHWLIPVPGLVSFTPFEMEGADNSNLPGRGRLSVGWRSAPSCRGPLKPLDNTWAKVEAVSPSMRPCSAHRRSADRAG